MAKFVELVLTALQYQAEGMLEIADIFLSSPAESRRWFHHIPTYERHWFKTNWAETYRNRQQFYKTLDRLRHEGFIVRKGPKRTSSWILTKRGEEKIETYRERRADPFSSAHVNFAAPEGGGVTIVTFDIPETERRKRNWVRACLAEMDFRMLQKSVWVAHGQIDEDFVYALRERDLMPYIHIFSVAKRGTVRVGEGT
jgi:hypothetical protein